MGDRADPPRASRTGDDGRDRVTTPSAYELVRRDLLRRENEDIKRFGAPASHYEGSEALLDAYDTALDLACVLRQFIENLTVGDGSHDVPEYGA